METEQITKDTLKTLRILAAQVAKAIEMLENEEDVVVIYNMLLAVLAGIDKVCNTQFIHLLRNDVALKSELLHENPKITLLQNIELDIIDKQLIKNIFKQFTSVFKDLDKMDVSMK